MTEDRNNTTGTDGEPHGETQDDAVIGIALRRSLWVIGVIAAEHGASLAADPVYGRHGRGRYRFPSR